MAYVTTVDVPSTPERFDFALEGVRPNPARRGPLFVHFSLANDAPARLELFDVRGRRVATQNVSGLGAGFHAVALEGERPLPAGIYLLRLTQGAGARFARAVVTD